MRAFDGVSYAFPNCPELVDSAFELDRHKLHAVTRAAPHRFSASGISVEMDKVWIHGRLYRHGTRAKGWFKVLIHPFSFGCTTGKVFWKAAWPSPQPSGSPMRAAPPAPPAPAFP